MRQRPREHTMYVAGAETLIGSALLRQLDRRGYSGVVGRPGDAPDLTDADQVEAFFSRTSPEYVFLAAGKSGGIRANQRHPAELMRHNLLVACHVIGSAARHGAKKLLYLASSCCYPKHCPQPMAEASLMTGPLEPTSEAYAVAKLAGLSLCQAYRRQYGTPFISGIPADIFGPGDDFDPDDAHVVAALIRRMHEAKVQGTPSVAVWGSGTPRREFLFADDLADACLFVMERYEGEEPINLGGGAQLSIREVAALIQDVVGYRGDVRYDTSQPDGMPVKWLDASRLTSMGWKAATPVRDALAATYQAFLDREEQVAESRSRA